MSIWPFLPGGNRQIACRSYCINNYNGAAWVLLHILGEEERSVVENYFCSLCTDPAYAGKLLGTEKKKLRLIALTLSNLGREKEQYLHEIYTAHYKDKILVTLWGN